MLKYDEKRHIKDVLAEGLNINRNINFPYFLDAIDGTNKSVKALKSQLDVIMYNQKILDDQLRKIIDLLVNIQNKL